MGMISVSRALEALEPGQPASTNIYALPPYAEYAALGGLKRLGVEWLASPQVKWNAKPALISAHEACILSSFEVFACCRKPLCTTQSSI